MPERAKTMDKKVGLWLDRKKAVIVSITNEGEAKRIISSDMEHYILYSTVVPGDGAPEEMRDKRFWNHLNEYYDKIIAHIGDAAEIQIFGPEVAKYELKKRLDTEGLSERIVSVENAGQLTNIQIATRVEKRFPARSQFDIF
jgi:predicted class III extradiol MEMO1 family dioxygenase